MRIISKNKLLFITLLIAASTNLWSLSKADRYDELMKTGSRSDIIKAFKKDNTMKNSRIGAEKDTLIMRAIKYDRPEQIISLLLRGGIGISEKNKNKQNALMYACMYSKNANVIKLVLRKTGNSKKIQKAISEKDKTGKSALDYAEQNEDKTAYNCISAYLKNDKEPEDIPETNPMIVIEKDMEEETEAEPEENIPEVTEPEEPQPTVTETETFAEEEKNEIEAPVEQETENAVNVVEEEVAVVEEKAEEAVENTAPASEANLPEESPTVNKYDKTYLYDFIVMEEDPEPEEEPDTEELAFIENPDKKDKNGRTALMLACKAGNDWEIKSLLHSHADINLCDKDGWTALMYAVRYQNNMEIVNLLINNGANVSVKNKFGATPLQLAASYTDNPDILKKLVNITNPSTEELFRAFILAITSSNNNAVTQITKLRIFLDRGIAINRFFEGKTPLMYAAEYACSTSVIKLLLDNGAVSGIRTAEGKTAFNFAESNKHLEHNDIYWSLNGK